MELPETLSVKDTRRAHNSACWPLETDASIIPTQT